METTLTALQTISFGIISYFITKYLDNYLGRRKIKKIKEKLILKQGELLQIQELKASGKSLVIYAFENLFMVLSMIGFAFLIPIAWKRLVENQQVNFIDTIQLIMWMGVLVFSVVTTDRLKKVKNAENSIPKMEKQIKELESKLENSNGKA